MGMFDRNRSTQKAGLSKEEDNDDGVPDKSIRRASRFRRVVRRHWPVGVLLAGSAVAIAACGGSYQRAAPDFSQSVRMDRSAPAPSPMMAQAPHMMGYSPYEQMDTNEFVKRAENEFVDVNVRPLSTFSADVDTASFALVRSALESGQRSHDGSVRTEEMVNYFRYAYAPPVGNDPFAIHTEVTPALWNPDHMVLRVGLKAKDIDWSQRKPSNLVFLIDTSGSMYGPQRLGLVKRSLEMLTENLDERDTVSIVTYAGSAGIALPPIKGSRKNEILRILSNLEAGGSTQGSAGIRTAYDLAERTFIKGGINRVILCTDGDFNVGVTNTSDLMELIRDKAKSGVFLTVLGYGMGNFKDDKMMQLADNGNGMYAYIDTALEAKRVLVEQVGSSLITVAKDVKLQVEFNPAMVASYRLIGYEKRLLDDRDFNDDGKDAGDIGAGHTVTALYELVPAALGTKGKTVDPLKYSAPGSVSGAHANEWATVKLRYKDPDGDTSRLMDKVVTQGDYSRFGSADTRWAMGVAAFSMLLNKSPFVEKTSYDDVLTLVSDPALSNDDYRKEFIGLVAKAKRIMGDDKK